MQASLQLSCLLTLEGNTIFTCVRQQEGNTTRALAPTIINFAPFSAGGGWVAAVNAKSPMPEYQAIAASFYAYLGTPNSSWEYVTSPEIGEPHAHPAATF